MVSYLFSYLIMKVQIYSLLTAACQFIGLRIYCSLVRKAIFKICKCLVIVTNQLSWKLKLLDEVLDTRFGPKPNKCAE